jgi:hypothetical protein
MGTRSPLELREAAREFRRLAGEGDDAALHLLLLQVASEFEEEATRAETAGDAP